MKYCYSLIPLILLTFSACEEESPNPIYLHENGVTVMAHDWAKVGDIGTLDGYFYKIVDREELKQAILDREDIQYACTSRITDMHGLFSGLYSDHFRYVNVPAVTNTPDISSWDVSNVTDMRRMFYGSNYSPDLSKWNVSKVKYMSGMFGNSNFNGDLSSWDVSNVNFMSNMFEESNFNGDLSMWDVSNVVNMNEMFAGYIVRDSLLNESQLFRPLHRPNPFNQDISNWDVSKVTNMNWMFEGNPVFNQDLSSWNVENVRGCSGFENVESQWTLPKPNFTNCEPG